MGPGDPRYGTWYNLRHRYYEAFGREPKYMRLRDFADAHRAGQSHREWWHLCETEREETGAAAQEG